jgi:hypothetical protein
MSSFSNNATNNNNYAENAMAAATFIWENQEDTHQDRYYPSPVELAPWLSQDRSTANPSLASYPSYHPSICIPRVFANISEQHIREVIHSLNFGAIEQIDIVQTKQGKENHQRVFIHFHHWFYNEESSDVRMKLIRGEEIHVPYDGKRFWKLSANKASRGSNILSNNSNSSLHKEAVVRSALKQLNGNVHIVERQAMTTPERVVKTPERVVKRDPSPPPRPEKKKREPEEENNENDNDNKDGFDLNPDRICGPMPRLDYGNLPAPKRVNRRLVDKFSSLNRQAKSSIMNRSKSVLFVDECEVIEPPPPIATYSDKDMEIKELKEEMQKMSKMMESMQSLMVKMTLNKA